MIRNVFFAAIFAFSVVAAPVMAKEDSEDAAAPTAQETSATKSENSLGSITEAPGEAPALTPEAAVPLNDNTSGPDALANFGPSSGTVVGNRALELRDEVLRLRASVNLNSNQFAILRSGGAAGAVQYHSTVAAITARLQSGTTRGNPILLRQWQEANSSLEEVTSSLGRLNSLQTSVDADASLAAYLLESVQAAFQLSGAVDEDHDQLKLLRDEISRFVVQLDYLRNQTTNDIQRQTAYLTTERENLQALAFAISRGELLGNSLANRPVIVNTPVAMSLPNSASATSTFAPTPEAAPAMPVISSGPTPMSPREYMEETGQSPVISANASSTRDLPPTIGRLLVLIRYNQPVVDYEQQLSQAVGTAMERRPNAQFSVVAVSPSSGDPASLAHSQETAERDAEAVKRSLIQLGLAPSHIIMASTQTQSASTPEVHVYVR
ncbi:MAG: hypothetical protein M3N08_02780 [Pseudomonadota bacterium]|nr:hypothetical protein [Pseudomonadota bacterium]